MEIRILEIIEVPESFHARYAATSKLYTYHLHLSPVLDPFTYKYRHHPLHPVDLSLLTQAASLFLGTHDFSAFANESHTEGTRPSPIRTLRRLDVTSEEGGVRLEFEAEGFLYKMVRNITGTLLDVSSGRLPLEEIPKIFASKDRRRASSAAPAQGLFLMRVGYDPQEKTRGTR
jgi:tRNA pseudouridine38-40 synthase